MDAKKNKPFSLSILDRDYFDDRQDKIQLVNCKPAGINCKNYLVEINKHLQESEINHRNKNYRGAIEALKNAYNETVTMKQFTCSVCVDFFHETIIKTHKKIYNDLRKMSTGLFKTKRYTTEYILAEKVLDYFLSQSKPSRVAKMISSRDNSIPKLTAHLNKVGSYFLC